MVFLQKVKVMGMEVNFQAPWRGGINLETEAKPSVTKGWFSLGVTASLPGSQRAGHLIYCGA